MNKQTLLAAAAGAIVGAVCFNVIPARADLPTIDVATDAILGVMQTAVTGAINAMESNVTDAITGLSNPNSIASLLRSGFTQNANYAKAQVGAQQQIADASNAANAVFQRNMRNVAIRDEHTLSNQACVTTDTGQVLEAASLQGWRTQQSIESVTDQRGEAAPGSPASMGTGQAMTAAADLHMQRYCSQTEANAGLCSLSEKPNFDQRASTLFGTGNLLDQDGVNAANDYGANLIQPVPPAALRGDQLTSVSGQDAAVRRRAYNARISLARSVINYAIGIQTPGVQLTAAEQQEMTNQGVPVPQSGSWLQVIGLEVDRRVADVAWATSLQSMPPASVLREIATELALSNYLAYQNYRVQVLHASVAATSLAASQEQSFKAQSPLPTPAASAN